MSDSKERQKRLRARDTRKGEVFTFLRTASAGCTVFGLGLLLVWAAGEYAHTDHPEFLPWVLGGGIGSIGTGAVIELTRPKSADRYPDWMKKGSFWRRRGIRI